MISTKGRYALRVMIDLAEHGENGVVPLKAIAERQNISKKYLELIMKKLVEGGFIVGSSGKGGGYRLTRSPGEYALYDILECTEETLATVACLRSDAEPCANSDKCTTLPLWREFDRTVRDFFGSRTLLDLM